MKLPAHSVSADVNSTLQLLRQQSVADLVAPQQLCLICQFMAELLWFLNTFTFK